MDRFLTRRTDFKAAGPADTVQKVLPSSNAPACPPAFSNNEGPEDIEEFPAPLQQSVVEDFFQPKEAIAIETDGLHGLQQAGPGFVNLLQPAWSRLLSPLTLCGASKSFLRRDSFHWFLASTSRMKSLPLEFAGNPAFPTTGMTANVTQVEFDHLGALFITATGNGVVRLYDHDDTRAASTLIKNATATNSSVALSSAPEIIPIHTFQASSRVQQIQWMPQQEDVIFLCCQSTQEVTMYNLSTLPTKPTRTLNRECRDTAREIIGNTCCYFLKDAAEQPSGQKLLVSDGAGYTRLWDLRNKGGPVWTVSSDAGAKAAQVPFTIGAKRPRDETGPGIVQPRLREQHHCAVKHLGQLSSTNEFQAMLSSGMFVEWDLRKMTRQAFGTGAVPANTRGWNVTEMWLESKYAPPDASGRHRTVHSVLCTSPLDPCPYVVFSDGNCCQLDFTVGGGVVVWGYSPTDPRSSASATCVTTMQACDIVLLPSGPALLLAEHRLVAQWPQMTSSEPAYYRGPAGARFVDPQVLFDGSVLDVVGGGRRDTPGRLAAPVSLDFHASACRAIPRRIDEVLIGGPEGDLALFADLKGYMPK